MVSEPSSLRPWQEQLVQHVRTGRLRYLQRIAVVCAALEPRGPFATSPSGSSPPLPFNSEVVTKHGRIYIPNPFLLPTLHRCVVCIRTRSLTLKRILAALSAGDLSPILVTEIQNIPSDVPLLLFLLSCVYVHLVQVKGEAAAEIEHTLQTAGQSKSLAKYSYSTPPISYTTIITAILNRTLRFAEPNLSEQQQGPLFPFDTSPLSLYLNELLESVFLDRWAMVHNAKALVESIKGAVDSNIKVEVNGKEQQLPPATTQEAWNDHVSICFDLVNDYQFRSPTIAIAMLRHMYQLHHPTSLRKGPRGYRGWWEKDRTRRLSLLLQLLQNAAKYPTDPSNQEVVKYAYYLFMGWSNYQQPHELTTRQRRKEKGKKEQNTDVAPLDEAATRLVVEATETAKTILLLRDINFAPSLVFLFLSVGVLLPFSELMARATCDYIIGLLADDSWADFITSHQRSADILLPFADFLAVLRDPSDVRAVSDSGSISTWTIIVLWRDTLPMFNDSLLVHAIFKVAATNAAQSGAQAQSTYSAVSSVIHEFLVAPLNDSVRFTSLFAASGVLKGIPSVTYPHVYILLQEVIVTALHQLDLGGSQNIWKSAVGLALAQSGLCSKNTTLDIDYDVPKALDLLVQVLIADVFGEWIFAVPSATHAFLDSSTAPLPTSNSIYPGDGLDIHFTPSRAHAHAKTAHYASSSAFTSSIARLFTTLPANHPSREVTISSFLSYAKLTYESWREFTYRTEESYTDSSVVTASLFPVVQVAQLAVTLFSFYATQISSSTQKQASTGPATVSEPKREKESRAVLSKHVVDAVDALGYPTQVLVNNTLTKHIYLEFAGADVPRFYSKLANLFMNDPATLEKNLKELIYRIPIPASAYVAFQPSQAQQPPTAKDGKALLARVAFMLRVIEPLAPLVDSDTLTYRLIPVAFALISHSSEQVRRSAHAVIHSLLAFAPISLAQSLVPSYCRIALASALVDDVPVPSTSNNAQIADYLYESMAAIFRRMSPPVALIAVKALANAAMNAAVSSSDGIQHKKLILLLLSQTVVQVDTSILDITLAEISKIIKASTDDYKYTLLNFLHRVVSRNVDYTRKTHLASWFLYQVSDAKLKN